ncbi:MAG TPA: hypothetical protein DCM40_11520 [Maribacter sp.]|nr:hypothetical protein [Maribacter sp.]
MDPVTLALIMKAAQGGAQGVGSAVQSIGSGVSKIDRLSTEERNRMKELERQQALGLLGLDAAQEQAILNQNLQPVQSLQRELIRQQQQQQSIGDIGQGAAFRQQQAQQGAMQQATSAAQQQAQDQILQLDRLAEAEQKAELARLKQQRQQNIQGAFEIAGGAVQGVGAVAGAVGQGASVKAFLDEGGAIEALLDPSAYAKQIAKAQTEIVQKTSAQPVSPGIASEFEQAIRASVPAAPAAAPVAPAVPVATPATPTATPAVPVATELMQQVVPSIPQEQLFINPMFGGVAGPTIPLQQTPEELFLQRINMQGQNLPLSRNAALAGASRLGMETSEEFAQQQVLKAQELEKRLRTQVPIPVNDFVGIVNKANISDSAKKVYSNGYELDFYATSFLQPDKNNDLIFYETDDDNFGVPKEFFYVEKYSDEEINRLGEQRYDQVKNRLQKQRENNRGRRDETGRMIELISDQQIRSIAFDAQVAFEDKLRDGKKKNISITYDKNPAAYEEALILLLEARVRNTNPKAYEQLIINEGL